jgi:DNA mismatch endonuclease (patch repair protein)
MARVKNKNTAPELLVRRALHKRGYRFRLHRRDLPGNPDIVLPRYRTVIFVHGCFWHGHDCARGKRPATRTEFWDEKLDRNIERDRLNQAALKLLGWTVIVIWECDLRDSSLLDDKLKPLTAKSMQGTSTPLYDEPREEHTPTDK